MSSTIVPVDAIAALDPSAARVEAEGDERKDPFLIALGERVRALRARRGMTRKALAAATDVSERHLANLEYGVGNASVLVLLQVTRALHCSFAELLGDVTTRSPEWLLIREMLENRDEPTLRRVRVAVGELLGTGAGEARARSPRIALIGLRGAGKSTLGRMLAEDLDFPFVELTREIEKMAGCSTSEILGLYGQNAYRRYERRALEEAVQIYPEAVIATAGGMVSDLVSFNLLLAPLHHRLAAGRSGRPHDARRRPGRHAPDGRERGGDGGFEVDFGGPGGLLFQGGCQGRHQRPAASRDVSDLARGGARGAGVGGVTPLRVDSINSRRVEIELRSPRVTCPGAASQYRCLREPILGRGVRKS